MKTRSLLSSEITALENQGCFSSDWSDLRVSENFTVAGIFNTRFKGKVVLGQENELYNCSIINSELGNFVRIEEVSHVQNYRIKDRVVLKNTDSVIVEGSSSFGNGTGLNVLNEAGGRELRIFDGLSAQLAYMLVLFRHDQKLIKSINQMIEDYSSGQTSEMGTIGEGTTIQNAGSIYNVNIDQEVRIQGASLLENGTIISNKHAPTFIGTNVIAKNFIVLSGSRVDGGAILDHCFVGQGTEIGKQFSAEHCVFFANCEAFHGEAVSIFAGPYTVSHHKSTLLIAGIFSFYNAGSGTNQSNHMYKLGPVHQGIVERGSKTGSFAYLLWPGRIGAFSVVVGKHMANFDTGDFPFSYITLDHEKSILTPGMNLFTVGTRRDSRKWPDRDRRQDPEKADLIHFDLFSPYIIQKVIRGMEILSELYDKASKKQETVFHKGIRIKRLMLKSTRKYYQMALDIFIGDQLIKKLDEMSTPWTKENLNKIFNPRHKNMGQEWIDMAGMLAPSKAIAEIQKKIITGRIDKLDKLQEAFKKVHLSYDDYAWDWTLGILKSKYSFELGNVSLDQIETLITSWESESVKLDRMILNDAGKEFDNSSKIGYGIDGDQSVAEMDFESVRGSQNENRFIKDIDEEITQIQVKAVKLMIDLKKIT